ncbi:MAG: hypothetical protein COA45_02760 [Zetaproteobacteria bacterium]|nr:MAG: hypothetical protein COA45_02760 [Zetaproteobacteria bacterium]
MKNLFRNITLMLVFTTPIFAQGQSGSDLSSLCRQIDRSNKGAEYVPGVDVGGKRVVSADVSSTPSQYINNPIIIPIEIDIIGRFGLALPADISLMPTVANLKIYQDGRVKYNDEDVTDHVVALCKDAKEIEKNTQSEHGHSAHNPLPSSDKIEGQYPDDREANTPHYNE